MVEDSRTRISRDEAVGRVGRAIYGGDWIGSLTKREEWLVRRYVDDPSKDRASTMPGQTTYCTSDGRKWPECPGSPKLLDEVTNACDRRDCSKEQGDEVVDWLEDHGFDSDASSFDRDALLGELEKEFSSREEINHLKKRGGRPPSVDWKFVESEVIRLMAEHGEFGPDDPQWNAQARLEEKIEEFCNTKFGRRPVSSTIQTNIKPMLVKWRAAKRQCPKT